jgi:hypothetical protein
MSAYEDPDKVLSERLRELVRLAGAGELADVECEPGGPFEQGLRLTGRTAAGEREPDGSGGTDAQHGRDARGAPDDDADWDGWEGWDAAADSAAGQASGTGTGDAGGSDGTSGAGGDQLAPVAAYAPYEQHEQHRQGAGSSGPQEPDLPDGPHAPETPSAPDAPEVPEGPDLPGHAAPPTPDVPNLPGAPELPDVPGPAEPPVIPEAPDILESPEIPPAPDIPPAPEFPGMPEVPEAPEIPESPGIYDQPEIPDPPQIDDPVLPEVDRPAELPGPSGDPTSPVAPDLPRPPEFPDAPPPAPGGTDAVRDAVTAMHSNHQDEKRQSEIRRSAIHQDGHHRGDSQLPDGQGRFGHEGTARPTRRDVPARGGNGRRRAAEGTAALRPVPSGDAGSGGSGGGPAGAGGGRGGHGPGGSGSPHGPGGSGGHRGHGGHGGHGGSGGDGSGGADGSGGGEGDSEVEAALRRMLHESVSQIEPAPESLAYLQHAVPARRAHRRRVLVGAAAAVVLAGVGVPGLVGSGIVPGLPGDSSYNAGGNHDQSQSVDGGSGFGDTQGSGNTLGGVGADGSRSGGGHGSASPSPTQGTDGGADSSDNLATSAPSCGRQQLGHGTASEGHPASDGKVYGSFRVVNTSSEACTVEGEGVVGASAQGRADIDRINVVDHTPGDDAPGLPDPALAESELVLKPGEAYEVKWAWVPSECGPPGKPDAEPKAETGNGPEGSQGGNNGNSGGNEGDSGGEGDAGGHTDGGDGGAPGGDSGGDTDKQASVVLSHTPDVGDPAAADTELEGACAGTLYRTGVLAADD